MLFEYNKYKYNSKYNIEVWYERVYVCTIEISLLMNTSIARLLQRSFTNSTIISLRQEECEFLMQFKFARYLHRKLRVSSHQRISAKKKKKIMSERY